LIQDRIGWGKTYLKQAGLVSQPARGMVTITAKGKTALTNGELTLKQLKSDSEYIAAELAKQKDKVIEEPDKTSLENSTPQDLIDFGFSEIEKDVKGELLNKFKLIDPYYFEKTILILLNKMGYGDFIETKKSNDGGIDGIINQDQLGLEKIYIQAKRYTDNKVREKDIRNFIGAMSGDTSKGIFVTTSTFDEAAIVKAKEAHHKIVLIDGMKLVNLMYEYGIGTQVVDRYEIKEIDEDFFESS